MMRNHRLFGYPNFRQSHLSEERFYVVFLIGSMSAYAVSQLISKGSDIRHENPVIPSDTPIDIEMARKLATTPMSGPCATKLRCLLDHACLGTHQ